MTESLTDSMESLGALAMQFRETRDLEERERVASQYRHMARRLKAEGKWVQPPPEDELPPMYM